MRHFGQIHANLARSGPIGREARRQENIRARGLRLKILQDHDHQVDKALLFDGPIPIQTARPWNSLWFVSHDMAGDPGYILQYLGALVKASTFDDSLIHTINERLYNMDWETDPYAQLGYDFVDYGDGTNSSPLFNRLHWLENAAIDPNDPVHGVKNNANPPGNQRAWDSVYNVFTLLDDLKLIERFIDPRNFETQQKPLADGTNLESSVLRAAWVLHRAWIRSLHYRSLYAGVESYDWNQIFQILQLVWAFYEGENMEIPKLRKRRNDFGKIYDVFEALAQAMGSFTTELFTETRPKPLDGAYTEDETIVYNLENQRFEALWLEHFAGIDGIFMLWGHLLAHAKVFEQRSDWEHVEDVMVDHRVVGQDERYHLDVIIDGSHRLPDITQLPTKEDTMLQILQEISRVNRHRRNYLLLRDWSKRRPWKQLYCIFNTAAGEQDYFLKPITDFYDQISALEATDPAPHVSGPSPSRPSNIWSSLFTFHPVASTAPPTQLVNSNYSDGCVICIDDFEPCQSIVQLKCNHVFHFTCVRNFWDTPGRHSHQCPFCRRSSIEWLLHEEAGVTPEVWDVWDNEDVTSTTWARGGPENESHPDIHHGESEYMILENRRLDASADWGPEHGPRSVGIEMARVRQARRKRNKKRREQVAKAGVGIGDLDGGAKVVP